MFTGKPLPMSIIKRPGCLLLPRHMRVSEHITPFNKGSYVIKGRYENYVNPGHIPSDAGFYYLYNSEGGGLVKMRHYFFNSNGKLFLIPELAPTDDLSYCMIDSDGILIQRSSREPFLFQYVPSVDWVWTGLWK